MHCVPAATVLQTTALQSLSYQGRGLHGNLDTTVQTTIQHTNNLLVEDHPTIPFLIFHHVKKKLGPCPGLTYIWKNSERYNEMYTAWLKTCML
jgi:hypothetical protein